MTTNVAELLQSGTAQANGQDLYYELHGDGPPLVLVMGIGYDSSLWTLAQVPVLSTQYQVIMVDNRDAGRSSKARHPYEIADMADDLAGLLDALGIQQTHVLGLSMGGMIAQSLRYDMGTGSLGSCSPAPEPLQHAAPSIRSKSGAGSRRTTQPAKCSVEHSLCPSSPQHSCATTRPCVTPPNCWQAIRIR